MELVQYILGSLLILLGLYLITLNYIRLIKNLQRSRRPGIGNWSSPMPIVGPLMVLLGSVVLPLHFSWWVLIAFLVDPDTILFVISLPYLVLSFIRR